MWIIVIIVLIGIIIGIRKLISSDTKNSLYFDDYDDDETDDFEEYFYSDDPDYVSDCESDMNPYSKMYSIYDEDPSDIVLFDEDGEILEDY